MSSRSSSPRQRKPFEKKASQGSGNDLVPTEVAAKAQKVASVLTRVEKAVESALRTDYHWSYTDEPHATRRREMLAKYPQIKELFGNDPTTKYLVVLWVLAQYGIAIHVAPYASWTFIFICVYCFGAFAAHALFLAMHEISHNLAFRTPTANRLLGVFANLGTVFPHFSMFQRYHMEHHQFQGVEGMDVDVPTRFEGDWFSGTFAKIIWVMFMPLVYVFRPMFVKPKKPGVWEAINWSVCIAAGVATAWIFGVKAISYLILSGFIGSGFHPIAGHFIAEHYVFLKGQETYSYYGPLNYLTFNVGYHNEHHDFPRIPGSRLHTVRAIAPEYYENLASYNSWGKVIFNYVFDPTVGPYSRMMRRSNRTGKIDADDYIESLGNDKTGEAYR